MRLIYPEALLVPVLMLADYFLTIAGSILREKAYSDHFRVEHYELNPRWRWDVSRKRWLNPRHLGLTLLLTALLISLLEAGFLPEPVGSVVIGALLGVFGTLVGRHINNLLIFDHLRRHPGNVTGVLTMSHAFVLSSSLYQTVMVFIPIAILAFVSQNAYAMGAALGFGSLGLVHLIWMRGAARANASKG